MGLSWQQGPLSPGAIGRFLVPEPLPKRLLYVEPLRRRMRVRFDGNWIADSENVLLLFEPGHYPMAYFQEADVSPNTLQRTEHTTRHPDLGLTSWYAVRGGAQSASRGAWQHIDLPSYASELRGRIAFAWPSMDAFYEEGERIVGHAADSYHRIDIRQTSRHLLVRHRDHVLPIPCGLWFSMSPASQRAGMFHVPMLMSLRSLRLNARLFARTRDSAATTTSVRHNWPSGRIPRHIPRLPASPTSCHSSQTLSPSRSTADSFILSPVRA